MIPHDKPRENSGSKSSALSDSASKVEQDEAKADLKRARIAAFKLLLAHAAQGAPKGGQK